MSYLVRFQQVWMADFEYWFPELDLKILEERPPNKFLEIEQLSREVARYQAPRNMRDMISHCRDRIGDVSFPMDAPASFWEGAITAFMNIYQELHPKKA